MARVVVFFVLIVAAVALEMKFNSCVIDDSLYAYCSNGSSSCQVAPYSSVNCTNTYSVCKAAMVSKRSSFGVNYVNTYDYYNGGMSVIDAGNDNQQCDLIAYSTSDQKYTFSCVDFAECGDQEVYVYV